MAMAHDTGFPPYYVNKKQSKIKFKYKFKSKRTNIRYRLRDGNDDERETTIDDKLYLVNWYVQHFIPPFLLSFDF